MSRHQQPLGDCNYRQNQRCNRKCHRNCRLRRHRSNKCRHNHTLPLHIGRRSCFPSQTCYNYKPLGQHIQPLQIRRTHHHHLSPGGTRCYSHNLQWVDFPRNHMCPLEFLTLRKYHTRQLRDRNRRPLPLNHQSCMRFHLYNPKTPHLYHKFRFHLHLFLCSFHGSHNRKLTQYTSHHRHQQTDRNCTLLNPYSQITRLARTSRHLV